MQGTVLSRCPDKYELPVSSQYVSDLQDSLCDLPQNHMVVILPQGFQMYIHIHICNLPE